MGKRDYEKGLKTSGAFRAAVETNSSLEYKLDPKDLKSYVKKDLLGNIVSKTNTVSLEVAKLLLGVDKNHIIESVEEIVA